VTNGVGSGDATGCSWTKHGALVGPNVDLIGFIFNSVQYPSYVCILLGHGDGTFDTQPSFYGGMNHFGILGIAVADLNQDHKPDIVTANFSASTFSVFLNSSNRQTPTVTLTSSPNPSRLGQTVTFTATVTPAPLNWPTETMTFRNGSTVLTKIRFQNGTTKFRTNSLPAGSDVIAATYNGDCCDYLPATSPTLTQVVK
jgi:hypothetical protein